VDQATRDKPHLVNRFGTDRIKFGGQARSATAAPSHDHLRGAPDGEKVPLRLAYGSRLR
jgi:hypothetical protein